MSRLDAFLAAFDRAVCWAAAIGAGYLIVRIGLAVLL